MMNKQRGNGVVGFVGILFVVAALIFGGWALASWKKVPAGHVGVHVYLLGGEKGVDSVARPVGRHFIGWQQELFLYPTFTQNYVWAREGDVDDSISFQDREGLEINADIGIAYNVDPGQATDLFQKYRKGVEEITATVLRNYVRDALNTEASVMRVEDIYGPGKAGLMDRAIARVKTQVEPFGIRIEKIYWIGSMRLPANVQKALNAKIEANQMAQQRENEVAQAIAEADKAREEAKGVADAQLLRAQAEAEAIKIRGDALKSNPELVALTVAEQWDGKLPEQLVTSGNGSGGPILQLLAPQK